jgi:hypothetical protein
LNSVKEEFEVKLKAYREKFKQLEEKELNFLESEFNKTKIKLDEEYKKKIIDFEFNLRLKTEKFQKQVYYFYCSSVF